MRKSQIYLPDRVFSGLVASSKNLGEVSKKLLAMGYGGDVLGIKRRIDALTLDTSHFTHKFKRSKRPSRPHSPWVYAMPEAEFIAIAKSVTSFAMFLRAVGRPPAGSTSRNVIRRRAAELGVSLDHFIFTERGTIPEKVLVKNSPVGKKPKHNLRAFLLRNKIVENKCGECGQEPFWMGEKLRLSVLHKNNIRDDLRPENLILLCPNCFSQEYNQRVLSDLMKVAGETRRKKRADKKMRELLR